VDRHGKNVHGTPRMKPNAELARIMREEMSGPPFILNNAQRIAVHREIEDVCRRRSYHLRALNVRTNHLHSVVTAQIKPEIIINAFKANATRALREQRLVSPDARVWSRGKSRRYLWKPRSVELAIDYALNQQGENLIEFETWLEMKGESLDEDE
jgi:REP element-mobilizing transposase RayT